VTALAASDWEFTLKDLLDHERFSLRLLSGSEEGPRRRVAGVHAMEVEEPSPWLPPDWLMLTTGLRLRGNPDKQRSLVRALAAGGMAGLGYSTGVCTKRVPAALVEEGERLSFPVFEIPFEVPLRSIVSFVQRVVLAGDPEVVRRVMAVQDYLLDGTGSANDGAEQRLPEDLILSRLEGLLGLDVAQVTLDGCMRSPSRVLSDGDLQALRKQASPMTSTEMSSASGRLLVVPVRPGDRTIGWLVVWLTGATEAMSTTLVVAESVARLLGLISMSRDRAPDRREAQGARLLTASLEAEPTRSARISPFTDLDLRARELGVDFTTVARALVVPLEEPAQNAWASVVREVRRLNVPALALRREGEALVLLQAERPDALIFAESLGRPVGLGSELTQMEGFGRSVADARFALGRRARAGVTSPVADFMSLSPAEWLIGTAAGTAGEILSREMLAPLQNHRHLVEALVAYLSMDQDVIRAGELLHLHPNSVRYRLAKVEEKLGASVRRTDVALGLYAALMTAGEL
jgi:purine catabolism regulator